MDAYFRSQSSCAYANPFLLDNTRYLLGQIGGKQKWYLSMAREIQKLSPFLLLQGAHHLEEVVATALQRDHGGRQLGDTDRGEPPTELVGIGHGECMMQVGRKGPDERGTLPYPTPCLP